MKHYLLSFALSSIIFLSFGQNNCHFDDFEHLIILSNKSSISDSEFHQGLLIVKTLEKKKCVDYIKTINGEEHVVSSLTYLFGQLCENSGTDNSIKEYIYYLKRNSGSAEEQKSFSFEYIFAKHPTKVLSLISNDTFLLNQLVWGFVNNRYYGEINPYKSDPNRAYTVYGNEPIRRLTIENYEDIFFKLNADLKIHYPEYKKQIDYLLNNIRLELLD